MYNFKVKSSVHDYEVTFIESFSNSLYAQLHDGDVIIIDKIVRNLYKKDVDNILADNKHIIINANEEQKSYLQLVPVIENLIENGFKKNNRLVAIGGGITQDVCAFISSIMYRGVSWLFYPTTLLAQGDSCIGSKTSINFGKYKNQLGGFFPPNQIFIDLDFLNTLAEMEIKSGLGEMCHYFLIGGEDDFERFRSDYFLAFKNRDVLSGLIKRSLEIKKSYIEIDEFDQKERQIFNYGHSFGHAIESLTKYKIPHGIAVSYGMDMANFISVKLGYMEEELRNEIKSFLLEIRRGTTIEEVTLDKFEVALSRDKKNVGSELRLILSRGFGDMFKTGVKPDAQFSAWLKEYFETQL